jgi:hypothetical protein
MSSFKDWRVLSTGILILRAIWRPVIIVALGVVAMWDRPVSVRLGVIILVTVCLFDWGYCIYFYVSDSLERWNRERRLASAMFNAGYKTKKISLAISFTRLAKEAFARAVLVVPVEPHKFSGPLLFPVDVHRWRLTPQGLMMTFRMPTGLTTENFEAKIRSLQIFFGHQPIEIRFYDGNPALVNVLFVLRDGSVRAELNSEAGNYLSHLSPGRLVISSPHRYPEYRINRPDHVSDASIIHTLRTILQLGTCPWGFWRIYQSGAVAGATDPRTFGDREVANDRSPEELLHWLHDETLRRRDYLKRWGVEHLAELPNYARPDPHLLVIDDIATLLSPSAPEDLDVEDGLRRAAACRAYLDHLGRNPQLDIHVIVGSEALDDYDSQNVSLRETLLVLGMGSSSFSTSDSNHGQVLTGDGSLDHLRRFAALCGRLWILLCLPIMVPRAMKKARNDDPSPKRK